MMLYKLKLAVCFAIPEGFGTCIISLVDESEKRALSITTTEYVAEQLKACNLKTSDFKNDVISVLWTLFDRQNVDDFYLEFDATPERGVYATLVNKITNERMSIKTQSRDDIVARRHTDRVRRVRIRKQIGRAHV